jgi:SAM-dependent methyltransferase
MAVTRSTVVNPLHEGVFTELAGVAPLDPGRDELESQRSAAARGCSIERLVLMADSSRRADADVRELVARDERAGIAVRLVDAGRMLLPAEAGEQLGIWDGEQVCIRQGDGTVRMSGAADELERAQRVVDWLRAAPRKGRDELLIDEPLATSAPLARAMAGTLCRPVGSGDPDCSAYHGLVQYLRLLGLVASPERQGRFYRRWLGAAAEQGRRRVLVAGAADYSMLAHVLAAYEAAGEPPEVTVLDRCPTPLHMSRWYAATKRVAIRTEQADVTSYEQPGAFDVIVTDSLLTLLAPSGKRRAVAAWARMLRPGGWVVTGVRLAPGTHGEPVRLDEGRVAAFARSTHEQAVARAALLEVDPAELAAEVHGYGTGVTVYPIDSVEEVLHPFRAASLDFEVVDVADIEGRVEAGRAGPGAHADARYARVVARR